jgi:hypothetical protein
MAEKPPVIEYLVVRQLPRRIASNRRLHPHRLLLPTFDHLERNHPPLDQS